MSMTKDQEALLELLVRVKEILDDNGIVFYLFGGSCIGALRHKGFIPWDYDIDIIMDRSNYEKLIAIYDKLPADDIEFCCFDTHDDYFKPFGQFSSKKDTYFLKSRVFNKGLCMGTIIDVFVMDYVPKEALEAHKKALVLYEETLGFYRLCRNEISDYKEEYFGLIEKEKEIGRRAVIEELQAEIEKYSEEEADLLVTRFWVRKLRSYNKEWFGTPRMCEFEGHMMPVPEHAEATLRLQYGYDWYMIPDEDEQYIHEFYVNHEISSNNYVEDMTSFLEPDGFREMVEKRKHYQVDRLSSIIEMDKIKAQLDVHKILLEVMPESVGSDFEKLNPILKNIKAFKQSGLSVGLLPEKQIEEWVNYLIINGQYANAMKVRQSFVAADSDFVFDNLLGRLDKLIVAHQDRNIEAMESALADFSDEERASLADCILAEVRLLQLGSKADGLKAETLIKKIKAYLEKSPATWDVHKALGDMLALSGQSEEAEKEYQLVLENSRNGLDLLELSLRS